jgi:hypothetical protein
MTLASSILNPPIKVILGTFLKVDDSEVARIPMRGPLILARITSIHGAPVGFSHLHPRPLTLLLK